VDICVSNLDFNTTREQLRAAFAAYGAVTTVSIASDRFTDQYRCLGFIQMKNDGDGNRAIQVLNGKLVGGRCLNVGQQCPAPRYGHARHIEDRWWKRRV
jgi:RNA recognition motif-containing protein